MFFLLLRRHHLPATEKKVQAKTRLKKMLVCRHPGLFFRVHPVDRGKKIIILR